MIPCIQRERQGSLAEQMSFLLSAAAQARKNSSERSLTLDRAQHLSLPKTRPAAFWPAQRRVILFISPSTMKCDIKLQLMLHVVSTIMNLCKAPTPPL